MTIANRIFPTLYKYTKSGAIQQWTVSAFDDRYVITYGQKDGKMQVAEMKVEKKNVGKSNETSLPEQAMLEAQSRWSAQLDKGYAKNAPKRMDAIKPMLAHSKKWEPGDKRVSFPCIIQPKLDGVRCIAKKEDGAVTLWTRKGKEITTLSHICQQLTAGMLNGEILDGELYAHEVEFQKIISWIKRHQEDSYKIQYHIYDMVSTWGYEARLQRVGDIVEDIKYECNGPIHIECIACDIVHGDDDIKKFSSDLVDCGYEGAILRVGDCTYRNGYRSRELLKVKSFEDAEFEIVGAEENKGRQEGQCCFICKTKSGAEFSVKPRGTDEERRAYWNNRQFYIGKLLTVRFFGYTTSDQPVPRFPVGIIVRDYE